MDDQPVRRTGYEDERVFTQGYPLFLWITLAGCNTPQLAGFAEGFGHLGKGRVLHLRLGNREIVSKRHIAHQLG